MLINLGRENRLFYLPLSVALHAQSLTVSSDAPPPLEHVGHGEFPQDHS